MRLLGVYAMVGSASMLCGFKRMSMAVAGVRSNHDNYIDNSSNSSSNNSSNDNTTDNAHTY